MGSQASAGPGLAFVVAEEPGVEAPAPFVCTANVAAIQPSPSVKLQIESAPAWQACFLSSSRQAFRPPATQLAFTQAIALNGYGGGASGNTSIGQPAGRTGRREPMRNTSELTQAIASTVAAAAAANAARPRPACITPVRGTCTRPGLLRTCAASTASLPGSCGWRGRPAPQTAERAPPCPRGSS